MSGSSEKLDEAAKTTDEARELASRAIGRLETAFNGRIVNGYGIYSVHPGSAMPCTGRRRPDRGIGANDGSSLALPAGYDGTE